MDKQTKIGFMFMFLLAFALFVSAEVSALELNPFANSKTFVPEIKADMSDFLKEDFNSKYGVIQLSKTRFWFKTDRIAEYSLTENTDQCLINCKSKGKAVLYTDGKLFDDKYFLNKKGIEVEIDSQYYIKEIETYYEDVPQYKEVCSMQKIISNNTLLKGETLEKEVCNQEILEYKKEEKTKEVWKEYNFEVLKAGEYEWEIRGSKATSQSVDFIPTAHGKSLNEWSWWNSDWKYNRLINLTADVGNFSYLYQVNYSENMQEDYDDLRFINNAETEELNFTIQSYNATSAIVRIFSKGESEIYMYYGNPLATSASSASDTHFNPIAYYYLDETSGTTAFDSLGRNNGTNNGADFTTGKINGAYDFEAGNADWVNLSTSSSFNITQDISISMWVKIESNPSFTIMLSKDCGSTYKCNQYRMVLDSSRMAGFERASSGSIDNFMTSNLSLSNGVWYHMVGVGNSTHNLLYINGQLRGIVAYSGNLYTTTSPLYIARRGNGNYFDGVIDEVGIWNKALTPEQVYQLYTYTAPTYTIGAEEMSEGVSITLNSPEDNLQSTSSTINFNATITPKDATIKNVTLYLNDEEYLDLYDTNEKINYSKLLTLEDGDYTWNITACWIGESTAENCTESETRSFIIDTTAPTITASLNEDILYAWGDNMTVNYNITDVNLDSCWYEYGSFANLCYQESENIQNQTEKDGNCQLGYTGNNDYIINYEKVTTPNEWIDGNPNTYKEFDYHINGVNYYINYTIPSGINTAVYNFKYGISTNVESIVETARIDIPHECFIDNKVQLSIATVNIYVGQGFHYFNVHCLIEGSPNLVFQSEILKGTSDISNDIYNYYMEWNSTINQTTQLNCSANQVNITTVEPYTDIIIYANDTVRNENNSLLSFRIDANPPNITVTSGNETQPYYYSGINHTVNFTIEDDNLDSVWWEYNGTNTTISPFASGDNESVTFPVEKDVYGCKWGCPRYTNSFVPIFFYFTIYANDTFGNLATEEVEWDYYVYEDNVVYNPTTTEGKIEDFVFSLTTASEITAAIFNYDGVRSSANIYSSGTNKTISIDDYEIPSIETNKNITFFLELTLTGGIKINSTSYIQSVQNLNFDDCSSNTFPLMNMSLYDEKAKTPLTGTIEFNYWIENALFTNKIATYNNTFSSTSNKRICSNVNLSGQGLYQSAIIRYSATGYVPEFYNVQRAEVDGVQYIKLYDLNESDSTEFLVTYYNDNFIKVSGTILQLLRGYINENTYEIVEAPLTSSEGTAIVHIDTKTNLYKAILVKDGVILNTFNDLVFACESPLVTQCEMKLSGKVVPSTSIDAESLQDFSYEISSVNNTITLLFSIPSGVTSSVNMIMEQTDSFGITQLCNKTVSSAGGTIECDFDDTIGESYVTLYVNKDETPIVHKQYAIMEDSPLKFLGNNFFIVFIMLLSVVGMAFSSPEWIIINSAITLLISGALWLLNGMDFVVGIGAIMWLLVGAIILISKLSKQEDR